MTTKNTIVITCYQRPEFLYVTLESYLKCKELDNYIVHFFPDFGYDKDTLKVIDWFKTQTNAEIKTSCKTHRKHKQLASYNILDSYRIATEENNSNYLIIGEEDFLVSPDYLRFNDYCYSNFLTRYDKIFCVAHKRRQLMETPGRPDILIGDPQCTSPSCISVAKVREYMIPLFNEQGYFEDPISFFSRRYPNSRIPMTHIDHDGAIERIIEDEKMFAIKPDQTRTVHIGFVGGHLLFNRSIGSRLRGSLDDKVRMLKHVISGGAKALRSMATHIPNNEKESWRGVTYTELEEYKWDKLILDIDRNLAMASEWYYDNDNQFAEYVNRHDKPAR